MFKKKIGNKKHEFISTWNWNVNNIAMMHLELNWIKKIKLKTNEIKIDKKIIQNLPVNMMKRKTLEKQKKNIFPCFFTSWEWAKQIPV